MKSFFAVPGFGLMGLGLITSLHGAERAGSLRVYCPLPDVPARYVRTETGAYQGMPPLPEAVPPVQLFYRQGKGGYTVFPFVVGSLSPAMTVKSATELGEGLYFKPEAAMKYDGVGEKGELKLKAEGGEVKDYVRLIKAPGDWQGHWLTCLYQPAVVKSWYPPKVCQVDLSAKAAPAGAMVVVNLTALPMVVNCGAAVIPVKPDGAYAVIPKSGTEVAPVKVAVNNGKQWRVVFQRDCEFKSSGRTLLIAAALRNQESTGKVRVTPYVIEAPVDSTKL